MSKWVVHVTPPFPLVGMVRVEVDAPCVDFARAKAIRQVGIRGCTATVRPAAPETNYRQDFLDSERARLLDRIPA